MTVPDGGLAPPLQQSSISPPAVELVPLREALAMGSEAWSALQAASPTPNPFMSWAWHRSWADTATPGEVESSRAFVLRSSAGQVTGLFPLRPHRTRFRRVPVRTLGWAIGDLGCPDHLDLLASHHADIETLVPRLDRLSWDAILLDNVAEHAPNLDRLCVACERRGWSVHRLPTSRCPYLALPDSWTAYLSQLSSGRRRGLRRGERVLRREHRVVVTDYGGERFEEGWRCLRDLHLKRWGDAGHLATPLMAQLHQRFASLLPPRGTVWLASLDLDGRPAAAWYGFAVGDTVYYYQSGWDPRCGRRSVGSALTAMMIRRAIEQGYRVFDFLRGEERYKQTWTGLARTCYQLVILRSGWRGAALRWLDRVARLRSTLLRTLSWLAWVGYALMDAA